MKAYFKSLKWEKGSRDLVQGVRGNRVPYNAISGGNGSFICGTPAKLILTVTTEDGRDISRNIISVVRAVNGWVRITQNRVDAIESGFRNSKVLDLDENENVLALEYYVWVS